MRFRNSLSASAFSLSGFGWMSIVPYVDRRLEYFTPKGRKEDRKMYAEINMEGRVVNDPEFKTGKNGNLIPFV